MAKLSPPLLEGTIPAFYSDADVNGQGIVKITIPFAMNRAVSKVQVGGLALKIKTIQSSSYLYTAQNLDPLSFELEDSPWVEFILHTNINAENQLIQKLRIGQFYKFQLAFIDTTGEIGYYSTVSIGKYTSKPELRINSLSNSALNMHEYTYTGFYSQQGKDSTERVLSYEFNVYDAYGNLFATSGEQLHNSDNDGEELYESSDSYILDKELEIDQAYRIQYTINTINGLKLSTPKYRIMRKLSIDPEMKATLQADLNFDNGYIDISLVGEKTAGREDPVTGAFLITRACSENNYSTWDEISRFKLAAQIPSRWLWRDHTIEQGKTYQYSIQQYNDAGLYSNRILSNLVYADFEDAFLYDGFKQLKIKYNPKVSSFKTDVLETKVDTIGGQHPFIFRNGKVYYHEFPISGLVSYLMDEENLFLSKEEFKVLETTTNLTSENLANERIFKMKVLEWLTNGEPKLFRSPSEGNFIVRLLNTSLSPNDTIGRMLHTFNSTAYEIAEFNYKNLNTYNFIQLKDPEVAQMRWETINFSSVDSTGLVTYRSGQVNRFTAQTVRFSDMMPGDMITIVFENGFTQDIKIGVTGSYYVDTGVAMKQIILPPGMRSSGSMTYSYYSIQQNVFDKVDSVSVIEVPVHQFIGEHDLIQEIEYVKSNKGVWRKNPKVDIIEFFEISAECRDVQNIVKSNNKYYLDKSLTRELTNPDDFTLYRVGDWVHVDDYRPGYSEYTFVPNSFEDFHNNRYYHNADSWDPTLTINGSNVSLEDSKTYHWHRPGKLSSLVGGNGVTIHVAYQIRIINYLIEDDEKWLVYPYKQAYLAAEKQLSDYIAHVPENGYTDLDLENEQILRENVKTKYRQYINALIDEQDKQREAEGLV